MNKRRIFPGRRFPGKALLYCGLLAAISGCATYSLEQLRHTTPQGTAFQNALSQKYMEFAIQEEKDYDWFSSMHFADKGLHAAYGKEVGPEPLEDWDIPEADLEDLQKARTIVMHVLTQDLQEMRPETAAKVQFYFDCWVEQQAENAQEDDIAYCRDSLIDLLDQLTLPPSASSKASDQDIIEELLPPMEPLKQQIKKHAKAKKGKAGKRKKTSEKYKKSAVAAPAATPKPHKDKAMSAKPKKPKATVNCNDQMPAAPPPQPAAAPAPQEAPKAEKKEAAKPVAAAKEKAPQKALEKPAVKPDAKPTEKPAEKQPEAPAASSAVPPAADTESYIVFFEKGSTTLNSAGQSAIDELVSSLKGSEAYAVTLRAEGKTALNSERMAALKKRLVEGGMNEALIATAYDAKTVAKPAGSTANARQIDIFLND